MKLNLTNTAGRKHRYFLLRSFLILLTACISLLLSAQKQEVDAVYLSNGEVYRGILKEHFNQEVLQLETLCSNVRLFQVSEVSRLEKETVDLYRLSREGNISVRGYFNRTDLGALIGSGNDNNAIFSIQMVNGYKFGKKYYPGVGVGLEFYDQAVVPLFADFTWVMGLNRVSPFLRGSIGYSVPLEDPPVEWGTHKDNNGGIMYGAGVGTRIRTGASSALSISLVYRFQSLKSVHTDEWSEDVLRLEQQYNRIAFRVGFVFD